MRLPWVLLFLCSFAAISSGQPRALAAEGDGGGLDEPGGLGDLGELPPPPGDGRPTKAVTPIPLTEPGPRGERKLRARLFATTSLRGEWESCACDATPLGGLSQMMAVVAESRRSNVPTFFVDAGNRLFALDMALPEAEEAKRRLGAMLFVDAANIVGLDAAGVGPLDLAMGLDYLRRLDQRQVAPFLAANLHAADGTPLFPASLVVERGGVRVGFTAVLPDGLEGKGYRSRDAKSAATRAVRDLRAQGVDRVVVLSTLGESADRTLARATGADVVVAAGSRRVLDHGDRVARSHLAEAGSRGRYLVDVRWYAQGRESRPTVTTVLPVPADGAKHPIVEALVQDTRRRLRDPFLGTAPVRPQVGP